MRLQVNQILHAVKILVRQSMWGDIIEKLNKVEQHPEAVDVEIEDFDADEDRYDPAQWGEIDDDEPERPAGCSAAAPIPLRARLYL